MEKFVDFYSLLGLNQQADEELIKRAYKIYSKKMHPDVGGSQEEFLLLREAYEILNDPLKRKQYDHMYNEFVSSKSSKDNSDYNGGNGKQHSEEGVWKETNEKKSLINWKKMFGDLSVISFVMIVLFVIINSNLINNATNSDEIIETSFSDAGDLNEYVTIQELPEQIKSIDTIESLEISTSINEDIEKKFETSKLIDETLHARYLNELLITEKKLSNSTEIWENGSDIEIVEFTEYEYLLWDNLLNEIYSVLKDKLSQEAFAKLLISQKNWIVERDFIAENAAESFLGGTWEMPILLSTKSNETKKRCYWLVNTFMQD